MLIIDTDFQNMEMSEEPRSAGNLLGDCWSEAKKVRTCEEAVGSFPVDGCLCRRMNTLMEPRWLCL